MKTDAQFHPAQISDAMRIAELEQELAHLKAMAKSPAPKSEPKVVQCCCLPHVPARDLSHVDPLRANLIRAKGKAWVNGTVLKYSCVDDAGELIGTSGPDSRNNDLLRQIEVVEDAMQQWEEICGITFQYTKDKFEAHLVIAFEQGAGSWSYVGRDNIDHRRAGDVSMNFGWDLTKDFYGEITALHELGHALGLYHEHQNPFAGIIWDREVVIADLSGPPNSWNLADIERNVLNHIPASAVEGSEFDAESVMGYSMPGSWIKAPAELAETGIPVATGLSDWDKETIRRLYPPKAAPSATDEVLEPGIENLKTIRDLDPGEQLNYRIRIGQSRRYTITTQGAVDTVMVLTDSHSAVIASDDDSGAGHNARLTVDLKGGESYSLRVRKYWQEEEGAFGLMMW